ncbi:MAG: putative sulfate/molybdate transporter [Bacteroidota bacterium]
MFASVKGIRFDRNELAGAFGDIGTDLPLLIGVILASGIDPASVLIMFGIMQVLSGLTYGVPMPVQPLKAFATLVIAQKITGDIIFAGGLAIGVIMLVLYSTRLIGWLSKVTPKAVVRGIQFGLGIQLASLAIKNYIGSDGSTGYILAGICFFIGVLLMGNRKFPPALLIIFLGVMYSFFVTGFDFVAVGKGFSFHLPKFDADVSFADVMTGLVLLALPQLPLSLSNSILATGRLARDYYPEKKITVQKISLTYSIMNIINPFFGGFPTCHGVGGMAGHYAFGGRTGGSVIIYGSLYLTIGLFFSNVFTEVIGIFPLPVLGVLLLFEAFMLIKLMGDTAHKKEDFIIAVIVGLIAGYLPYGFLVGLVVGFILKYLSKNNIIGLTK